MTTIEQMLRLGLPSPPDTPMNRACLGRSDSEDQASAEPQATLDDGLVICPITVRERLGDLEIPSDLGKLFEDFFPGKKELAESVAWGRWEWDGSEGSVPQLQVSPGLVRLTAPDLNRAEKRANRLADSLSMVESLAEESLRGEVTGWSRKSRARMISRLATLDYAPLMGRIEQPAMVTLTYPGDWENLAPNGEVVKKHLTSFFKRFERAWGETWVGVWKLEFQRRGAPHFHLLMAPPQGKAAGGTGRRKVLGEGMKFRAWLSVVWADICGAKGEELLRHISAGTGVDYEEGAKARNPRSAAQYFSKHGMYAAKEYQHSVPELWQKSGKSVGRFWGYRGLNPLVAGVTVTAEDSIKMARVLRGLGSRSTRWNGVTRKVETVKAVRRVKKPRRTIFSDGTVKAARDPETGEILRNDGGLPVDAIKLRWQTVPVRRMTGTVFGGGYLCVENGPRIAADLGRFLQTCVHKNEDIPPVGLRGSVRKRI